MFNMHRPCKILSYQDADDTYTYFDAFKVDSVTELSLDSFNNNRFCRIKFNDGSGSLLIERDSDSQSLITSVMWEISQALNAPVLLTEEVLASLPIDACVLLGDGTRPEYSDELKTWCYAKSDPWDDDSPIESNQEHVIAGNRETLEILLGFTLDGKPVA